MNHEQKIEDMAKTFGYRLDPNAFGVTYRRNSGEQIQVIGLEWEHFNGRNGLTASGCGVKALELHLAKYHGVTR